jgi:hypothetical protein
MGKADDLIADGTVKQSSTYPDKVVFNVPFEIPKAAVDAGAFELFAEYYGYRPQINQVVDGEPVIGEDGQAVMIDNPKSVYDACQDGLRNHAIGILHEKFLKLGETTGRQQFQEQFNQFNL